MWCESTTAPATVLGDEFLNPLVLFKIGKEKKRMKLESGDLPKTLLQSFGGKEYAVLLVHRFMHININSL